MSAISSGPTLRGGDVTKKKTPFASSRVNEKKSHRPVGTPEDRVALVLRKAPRARCREDAPLAPTRARDRPRRAAASSLGRPRHVPRTPRDPAAPDLDARARRRRDGRGWKTCSRSRLAIFQRPRLLACDATDARPRPREDARRERRGQTKPDREERAARNAAFRATTRAAREGSRRDAPPKPRVTTPRFPSARKAPVPRKFRRASAPETGHVGARDVPLVSVAGVRVRAPARVSAAALCDRP